MSEEETEEVEIKSPTGYVKCPICGDVVKSQGRFGHFSSQHRDLNYHDYKDKFVIAESPEPPERPSEEKEEAEEGPKESPYKGEIDTNSILRKILEDHPDVPNKVVGEIMSWAEMSGPLHPMHLAYLLSSMRGVTPQTANVVAQKYSLAITKAEQEGRIPLPLVPGLSSLNVQGQPQFVGPSQQWQWPQQSPQMLQPLQPSMPWQAPANPPTGLYTREDLERYRSDWAKEERLRKVEEQLVKLPGEIQKMVKPEQPMGSYEEITEYVDAKGNICDPDRAASIRVRKVPVETKGLTAEEVRRIVKEEKEVLTEEKVRGIIRSEFPRKGEEESPDVKSLREQLTGAMKSIDGLKEQIQTQDREMLLGRITELGQRLDTIASIGTGEWKSDEMRLIKSGVSDVKDLLKTYLSGERPLDRAERILAPAGQRPRLTSEQAGEAERGGVIQGLREHGLVTRVKERIRGEQ